MWSGCRQADAVVSQAYPGYAEICPGFPPPQAARVTVASEEKGLWVVWYDSDVVKIKAQGREIRIQWQDSNMC